MAASEPIGERRRLALIQRLTEVLGEEEAATIMESLPPTYWQNIATKDDLKAPVRQGRWPVRQAEGRDCAVDRQSNPHADDHAGGLRPVDLDLLAGGGHHLTGWRGA